MRLRPEHIDTIRHLAQAACGEHARVYLFGSRADDHQRGGDIDLYIESERAIPNRAAASSRLAAKLQRALGDQRIDIIIKDPDTPERPIHATARATGIRI